MDWCDSRPFIGLIPALTVPARLKAIEAEMAKFDIQRLWRDFEAEKGKEISEMDIYGHKLQRSDKKRK
ncbi:hypothetical protein KEM48_003294 [Puccinia striiformis f. sp. tritici PST-130]|nr:hypothetical protein KEM48_003294 [Puccinia striiformis f. sp. tritici PST-130]